MLNISSIVNTRMQVAGLAQSGSATGGADQLLSAANKRVGQQLASTNVQLSAYGQIKGAFGSLQGAAGTLSDAANGKTATSSDIVKAAQAFVANFNQAAQSVASGVGGQGALASDVRARLAGNDLGRALGGVNLQQVGITQNKNGTLTLDTKALEQALQANPAQAKSALAQLGQQVGTTVGQELGNRGNVGAGFNSLTNRSQSLAAQQTALQQQAESVQGLLQKQGAILNYATASGLAAYRSILG